MPSGDRKKETLARLHAAIARAGGKVDAAETELETAMRDLVPLVGDDEMITGALERCFDKLRTAKRDVDELRRLLDPK